MSITTTTPRTAGKASLETLRVPNWLAAHGKAATVSLGEVGGAVKARNANFDRLSAGEQDEYATLLHGHYVDLLRDNGVQSTQQHFELIRDKQRSDELCLDLGRRIAGDARLVELMAKLGVRTP